MSTLLQIALSNAVAATVLAIIAAIVTPYLRHPKLRHALWLLVLIKLVTPPVWRLSVSIPASLPDSFVSKPTPPLAPSPSPLDFGELSRVGEGRTSASSVEPGEGPFISSISPSPSPPDAGRRVAPSPSRQPLTEPTPAASTVRPHSLTASSSTTTSFEPPIERSLSIVEVLVLLWMTGLVVSISVIAFRIRRFSRALRRFADGTPPALRDEASEIAAAVGLRKTPRLAVIEGPLSPMVWSGSWRPVILFPRDLLEALALPERRLLIAHELLHVRRGDHVVRWFEMLVLAVYWWHPVAWWAARRLRQAEEECCDAAVLSVFPDEGPTYGQTLLATCEFLARHPAVTPLLASGFGREQHLKRRLNMILDDRRSTRLSKTGRLIFAAFATFAIAVSWNAAVAQRPAATSNPAATTAPVVEAQAIRTKTDSSPVVSATPVNFAGASGTAMIVDLPAESISLPTYEGGVTTGNVIPQCQAVSGQVSEKVRKQIIDQLMEGSKDTDPDVARQSLEGIARVHSSELATQALLAMLEKPAPTEAAQRVRLDFANRLLDVGIARDRVLDFLLKTATKSQYALVRSRAIGLLSYAKAANKSPDVARMLVATAEKPLPAPPAAAAHTEPGKSAAPPQTAEAKGSDRFPADPGLLQKLIDQAQRAERIGTADGIFVPRQYDQSSIRRERRAERIVEAIGPERRFARGDVDRKLTRLMGEYNEAIYAERWGDAERIANLFVSTDPRNPNGRVMQQQVKERRQVAQLAHPDRVDADGGFTTPDVVALLAIERTLPEVDDVAVVLIEALKHKDPRIRRAATTALANTIEHQPHVHYLNRTEYVPEHVGDKVIMRPVNRIEKIAE